MVVSALSLGRIENVLPFQWGAARHVFQVWGPVMKYGMIVGAAALIFGVVAFDGTLQGGDKKEVTIKQVMKKAFAGGLCKKVASGDASAEEKKELIALFEGLSKATPPKGEEASWKEKTKALLDAAKADDGAALQKAANCQACHQEHKGKKK
jgi:hypothetical protein